jgi:hypothetical protein
MKDVADIPTGNGLCLYCNGFISYIGYRQCGTGSYRQSEISVNIRNYSITVGTYFHDRSTDNGFTTRFFNDSTFYLDLLGKGIDARKEKHN